MNISSVQFLKWNSDRNEIRMYIYELQVDILLRYTDDLTDLGLTNISVVEWL